MKKLLTMVLVSMAIAANAQIPNSGFEQWESYADPANAGNVYEKPDLWIGLLPTSPSDYSFSVHKNAESYPAGTGQYSILVQPDVAKGVPGAAFSYDVFPVGATWPNIPPSFPVTYRPTSLFVYYKFLPAGGDTMAIEVFFYKNGGVIGTPGFLTTETVSNWTLLEIPMSYYTSDVPDSATIILSTFYTTPHDGSQLYVDNLSFDAPVTAGIGGAAADLPKEFGLQQNYPNPFNPTTAISYQLSAAGQVTLRVYDVLGREVATLVNERKPAGAYTVRFDASNLASGTYVYRLEAGGFVASKKLALVR